MKKKLSVSPVLLVLLLLLVIVAVYTMTYFVPAQRELAALQAEITLNEVKVNNYQNYLNDSSSLQKEIADLEDELQKMTGEYTNDSNVNFAISHAIQMYNVSLTSVSLEAVQSYNGHRALPINLQIKGTTDNVLQFIQYFETDKAGSYVVRGVSMKSTTARTEANIVLYLCTPSV